LSEVSPSEKRTGRANAVRRIAARNLEVQTNAKRVGRGGDTEFPGCAREIAAKPAPSECWMRAFLSATRSFSTRRAERSGSPVILDTSSQALKASVATSTNLHCSSTSCAVIVFPPCEHIFVRARLLRADAAVEYGPVQRPASGANRWNSRSRRTR
jgi:hypothetical protein